MLTGLTIILKSSPLTPIPPNVSFFHSGSFFPVLFFHLVVVGISQRYNHNILLSNVFAEWWHFSTLGAQTNENDSPNIYNQFRYFSCLPTMLAESPPELPKGSSTPAHPKQTLSSVLSQRMELPEKFSRLQGGHNLNSLPLLLSNSH